MTEYTDVTAINTEYADYPAGRYEQYESRMIKIAKVLGFIKKHKILISVSAILLTAAVLAFVYCTGTFMGTVVCEDATYGEKHNITANAFFATVRYEYSSTDGGEWTEIPPIVPGEYAVRGVTENLLGKKRYSDSVSFTLYPKDAVIDVIDASCQYGDMNREFLESITVPQGLAKGDTLTDMSYTLDSKDWTDIEVSVKEFKIIDSDGNDVTSSYNLTQGDGKITVLPRKITISIYSETKTYDTKPIDIPEWYFKHGSLAEGDELQISYEELPINAGRYSAVPDHYIITDAKGQDVTYKYNVQLEYSVMIIEPIPLLFSTGSAEKIYDGKQLTNGEWKLLEGSLIQGHEMKAQPVGERTIVGESKNTLSVVITDQSGNDVTDNYDIRVNEGKLTINPIVLTFATDSAEKIYDGSVLKSPGYKLISGQLVPGHRMLCSAVGMITDVGEAENTLSVTILDQYGTIVTTGGYKIVVEHGTLKVTPRPITISSASAQKLYDGSPLTQHSFSVSSGSLVNGDVVNPKFTGAQTEVGESPNYFTATILKSGGASGTKNYDITLVLGTLKVLPNENYVPGDNNGGNGNGNGGGNLIGPGGSGGGGQNGGGQNGEGGFDDFGIGEGTGIGFPSPDGPQNIYAQVKLTGNGAYSYTAFLRVTSYGDYNGSGFEAAENYTESYISPLDFIGRTSGANGNVLWNMHIKRLSGCPVIIPYYSYDSAMFGTEDSYFKSDITEYDYNFVKLTDDITKMRWYTHGAFYGAVKDYTQYVYDEFLQIPETTKAELLRIGSENGIYDNGDQFALADTIRQYVKNAGSYNLYGEQYPAGVDVAVYFLDVAKEGVCQHFAAAATMMYRAYGIPARYVTGFAVYVEPNTTVSVSTQDRHAWVEIYFDELGWIPVEVTGSGFGAAGTKVDLTVSAYSATKEYDGKPFSEWNSEKVIITNGQLLPGHTMKVALDEGRYNTLPGVYYNRITSVKIYDSTGTDVTDKYYKVKYKDGEMTIKKRSLVIQLGSASKKYDGTPLKCEEWRLVSGTILPDTDIRVETITEITDVGTALNQILHVYVYETKNGVTRDVSSFYDIRALHGTLEITE